MPPWLPSIAYPPARENGFWAPITSTLDWCEENYYLTPYSAEIINSLTNLLFLYLGLYGLYNCHTQTHDVIFTLAFIGYLIVGLGSLAFHSTLKYPMQLVDELSMIYTTCLMFWATYGHNRSVPAQTLLGLAVSALAVFITAYYHYLQEPKFHQTAYALLTALVLGRSIIAMEIQIRPCGGRGVITRMWTLVASGLAVFLGGFGVWSLDNIYCSNLRKWRHEVGMPWGFLLEGHGWWHLMTGLGAYYYITWGIWLRYCLNGEEDRVELVWPRFWNVPRVVRRKGKII
ncbi:alkaline phytoceramidase [Piedraia hortae CBS 480.64]|uniref:Alkaline phytoceramidase n=1 Tax=Piedraia hortae CBS 480.64 TaxID=1314780 RepID=A0A6A7C506_9PEZI|nr:alkaline phytoceramidase [Piedraia hortae CBS 480.64]